MKTFTRLFLASALLFLAATPALFAGDTSGSTIETSIGSDNLSNVDVFPNPVKTFLTVEFKDFDETNPANYTISIYNSLGKLISTDVFSSRTNKIDFTALQPGMYFVEIVCGQNKVTRRIQRDK